MSSGKCNRPNLARANIITTGKLVTRECPDVCLCILCTTGREFAPTTNEVEKPSWQQVEWINWGKREIRIFSWERNKKKLVKPLWAPRSWFEFWVPVMLLRPSSLKDRTMEVGLASPGATHFFLVRWCFPGCPTNLMPFGTEIFTWTCESFGNVIYWKYQLQSQADLCERCEIPRILHKSHKRIQIIHSSKLLAKLIWLRAVLSAQQSYKYFWVMLLELGRWGVWEESIKGDGISWGKIIPSKWTIFGSFLIMKEILLCGSAQEFKLSSLPFSSFAFLKCCKTPQPTTGASD